MCLQVSPSVVAGGVSARATRTGFRGVGSARSDRCRTQSAQTRSAPRLHRPGSLGRSGVARGPTVGREGTSRHSIPSPATRPTYPTPPTFFLLWAAWSGVKEGMWGFRALPGNHGDLQVLGPVARGADGCRRGCRTASPARLTVLSAAASAPHSHDTLVWAEDHRCPPTKLQKQRRSVPGTEHGCQAPDLKAPRGHTTSTVSPARRAAATVSAVPPPRPVGALPSQTATRRSAPWSSRRLAAS